ncbi:hypothetical protein PF005_g23474 [Phytophthora fragariae]|uniref:GDPGP1-like N-terminal domain-containing protein n=1 Tax=Phytophthora fragariae TaxID=53985 RepID=A0A6A3IK36_9STRA|nr:hypothetical protein PF011_g22233 [Phytophthora fragariae]KAE9179982.1 hypothetical protein PF005_g23474 [Phytophthora fragariae]KAE9188672.1 hypothetical protein PF004_g22434 [Phytophthora fragariae]
MAARRSLDELLLRRWDLAASNDVMRTDVNETIRRRIPGDLGLVVQFNPSHVKSKRPADQQLVTPVKPTTEGFNFTKAKTTEFLSGLHFITDDAQCIPVVQPVEMEGDGGSEVEHFVLVNVSPLVRGHLLFVLDMNLIRPQEMSEKFLLYALSISQSMQNETFALGFNSAGAWSSVSHFHLQGFFFPKIEGGGSTNFPVVAQPREEVFRASGAIVNVIPKWKTTCFVIEPEDGGKMVFVFPRQQQCENGVGLFTDETSTDASVHSATVHAGRLRIAVAELSGLVIAGDQVAYNHLTEKIFNTILQNEISLPTNEEAVLINEWETSLQ